MKYRSSKETSLLILTTLADQKEYAQYDLPKAIGKDYRTVLRHLQDMKKHHLVYLARTERSKYGGKDKKIYGLTLLGLFEVIHSLSKEELNNKIDMIAKKHADKLPLVFGKWEHFVAQGFRKEAISHLRTIPVMADILRVKYSRSSQFEKYYNQLERVFTHEFLFGGFRLMHFYDTPTPPFFTREDAKLDIWRHEKEIRWLQMLMLDPDLSKVVKEEFDWLIWDVSQYLNVLKKIRRLTIKR